MRDKFSLNSRWHVWSNHVPHSHHMQQMVFIFLSQVTILKRPFLTNATNDSTSHHVHGSTSPYLKKKQNEYLGLADHQISTITRNIRWLTDVATALSDSHHPAVIMINFNVKSLAVHAKNISSDSLLHVDLLAITEIWKEPATSNNIYTCNWTIGSPSGGVAVYKR